MSETNRSFAGVEVTLSDNLAVLDISSPDGLNGFDLASMSGIADAIRHADALEPVNCIVVRGNEKVFLSGASHELLEYVSKLELAERISHVKKAQEIVVALYECSSLTVGLSEGSVMGAGVDISLAMDFLYVSERTRFNFMFEKLGVIPDLGSLALLRRALGNRSMLSFYTKKGSHSARELAEMGLVSVLEPFPREMAEIAKLLRAHRQVSKASLRTVKESIRVFERPAFYQHLDFVCRAQAALIQGDEFRAKLARVSSIRSLGG